MATCFVLNIPVLGTAFRGIRQGDTVGVGEPPKPATGSLYSVSDWALNRRVNTAKTSSRKLLTRAYVSILIIRTPIPPSMTR
jgi:hypothetical protein